jgi:hypothetical protein
MNQYQVPCILNLSLMSIIYKAKLSFPYFTYFTLTYICYMLAAQGSYSYSVWTAFFSLSVSFNWPSFPYMLWQLSSFYTCPFSWLSETLLAKLPDLWCKRICDRRFVPTIKLCASFAIMKQGKGGGGEEFMLHKALPLFLDVQQKYETWLREIKFPKN